MSKIAEATIIKPTSLLSSFNDIWGNTIGLGLTTSNINQISINSNNFKYFIDVNILDDNNMSKSLGRFTTPPRPLDFSGLQQGYGAISTSSILRSYLYTRPITQGANPINLYPQPSYSQPSPYFIGSLVRYEYTPGFQYSPNLNCVGIIVNISGNDYLGFSFSQVHPFDITSGQIDVISDNPFIAGNFTLNPSYSASFSLSTYTPWTASMTAGGTNLANIIQYSQITNTTTQSFGFDAVYDYESFPRLGQNTNDPSNLIVGVGSITYPYYHKFLTNYPNWGPSVCDFNFFGNPSGFSPTGSATQAQCFKLAKRMKTYDYETLSVITTYDTIFSGSTLSVFYNFYDSSYNLIESATASFFTNSVITNSDTLYRWDIAVGFQNLVSGGLLTNTSSIDYIATWLGDDSSNKSEVRYFYIDRTCSIYEPVQVIFKNRLGAWEYFTFTQDKKKSHRIIRNQYKKQINWGETEGNTIIFQSRAPRGNKIISIKVEEEFSLNSNWITEIEYEWLSEMVESNDVYIRGFLEIEPDETPWVPIIITDTSYEFKTFNRDQIFNLTINYKLANDKPTQMI